ncbi:MAG TPA: cysteine desulfurase [Candidatus Avipropionibacterium avicola]|uniref:cysteine desulfurase n=1 Tax=Candidatus Avipropionibacterium avicola TaxID=2840701 RepID=A0A9D1H0S6_9ACTN|nr:cysteine desulfurase [Candidatus Avipropionibacterium avicola]
MSRDRHYLDHAASSPLTTSAAEAMAEWVAVAGNPSSLHTSGRRARAGVEQARESLAADLGCHPSEIVFTSSGTEADNIAVIGSWRARRADRNRVLTTAVEHPAVFEAAGSLRAEGADVTLLGVDAHGVVDPEAAAEALTTPTAVASLQWVNNETGVVQDVARWAQLCRTRGAWSHSDAVQACGHVPLDFAASGLDLMSVSAHKVGGPVGIGALVLRRDVTPLPLSHGGGQERQLRSATVPVALVAGFAAAMRDAVARLEVERERLTRLGEDLVQRVVSSVPDVTVNGAGAERSPAIVNLGFAGVRADDLLMLLDLAGIDCSTGSACTAGVSRPSEVLIAMGRTEAEAGAALRFSFGPDTGQADIDALCAALPEAVSRARAALR